MCRFQMSATVLRAIKFTAEFQRWTPRAKASSLPSVSRETLTPNCKLSDA
jgi:hypothetical protein